MIDKQIITVYDCTLHTIEHTNDFMIRVNKAKQKKCFIIFLFLFDYM